MGDTPEQLTLSMREHDLPPSWDGCPVTWEPWKHPPEPFICPPPKDRKVCEHCGSTKPSLIAHGTRVIAYGDNVVRIGRARLGPRETRDRLVAQRCPDCQRDVVWDLTTNEWWDLNESDYLASGSYAEASRG